MRESIPIGVPSKSNILEEAQENSASGQPEQLPLPQRTRWVGGEAGVEAGMVQPQEVDMENISCTLPKDPFPRQDDIRLQQIMAVLDGSGALSLASLMNISMPDRLASSSF